MKMNKERIKIEGNRYLIYYTFENDENEKSECSSCCCNNKKETDTKGEDD
ncbi:MAG: hypothetical protein SNJ70_07990 [Armatimonadota bacterium]